MKLTTTKKKPEVRLKIFNLLVALFECFLMVIIKNELCYFVFLNVG